MLNKNLQLKHINVKNQKEQNFHESNMRTSTEQLETVPADTIYEKVRNESNSQVMTSHLHNSKNEWADQVESVKH